jgi:ATP-dependent Clp protease ATP-binding subunit ClpX
MTTLATSDATCSFCAKGRGEVWRLVAGAEARICDQCLGECNEILLNEPPLGDARVPTPEALKAMLDAHVIGQEQAKKQLAVAVHYHYMRALAAEMDDDVELAKSNLLLLGPTGSGKTLLMQTIARALDVPFAACDATTLTEAGYVGEDVDSIIARLLQNAGGDVARAERGIVFIDEIDKIARKEVSSNITRDVSGEGVQQGLLKILEGTVVEVSPTSTRKHAAQTLVPVDTTHILFACAGAFDGLEQAIAARVDRRVIGYGARARARVGAEWLGAVEAEDLVRFGMIPELVGRLPVVAVLDRLGVDDLVRVLSEPRNSLVRQYQHLFAMDGVSLELTAGALRIVAGRALAQGGGARGLHAVLEGVLLDHMFEAPSLAPGTRVVIDERALDGPVRPLDAAA